jgi:hypothetical protein
MSNELTSRIAMPIAPASVEQTGTTNGHGTNQEGGIVNINYNYQKGPIANSAEQMMVVQSFSKEYYQLLVTCEDDVFTDNIVTVSASRALSQHLVPPEILERCASLSDEGIKELKSFPAIICRENTEMKGTTDPNQSAVYGYITRVKKRDATLRLLTTLSDLSDKAFFAKRNMQSTLTLIWTVPLQT